MADELGPTYFGGSGDNALNGRAYNPYAPKEYSDETGRHIDVAVSRFVAEAHQRAVDVLAANRPILDAVAEALIREESLDSDQFIAIVQAKRQGAPAVAAATVQEPTSA
jgi:cell division protease FtsH